MNLRGWTTLAIQEGGTAKWITGLAIKLSFELAAAVIFGWGLTWLVMWQFPVDALESYFGSSTQPVIWMVISAGLLSQFTLCHYTKPLVRNE